MKRSSRGRGIGVIAWLLGVVMPLACLAAFLTFSEPVSLSRQWPLGIGSDEAAFYARWLDRRAGDTSAAGPERYLFSSTAEGCLMDDHSAGWSDHWFEADGFGDSVKVRRMRTVEGGFVVKFRREDPFRAQRHIVLMPATVESIRAKYLELLAHELGLVTPEVTFVRVIACGKDRGIYLKEERIDADLLEKQGLAGAALFTQGHDAARPDHLFPAFEADTLAGPALRRTLQLAYDDAGRGDASALPYIVDQQAAIALLLMEWIAQPNDPFSGEHLFAYSWSKGRAVPLYRTARSGDHGAIGSTVMLDLLTGVIKNEDIREAFTERRLKLLDERWRMKERFAAMDRAWLPILAQGGSQAFAQATAIRIQEELLGDHRNGEDALAMLSIACARYAGAEAFRDTAATTRYWPSADDPGILQRIALRTKARISGDTIIFPRGRYAIEEDLTVPYGCTVILEEGARFEIAAARSVVVQGALLVRGSSRNPVFVRPQDESKPFGTFSVVSDGTAHCSIRGLHLSGGSEARVNGIYFSGQFAIHHAASTVMSECLIGSSHGEDLMNIKNGLVTVSRCVFEDGLGDLVDLDACRGRVADCVFRSGRADSNGDGLDVSGARVSVRGCVFSGMMDKGISVGEASQLLVEGSRFDHNRIAIAAKDLSIAYVQGNVFADNGIVFGAYRKKPIYGGARVVRSANEYVNNAKEQEVDDLSAVVQQDALDEKTMKMFPGE